MSKDFAVLYADENVVRLVAAQILIIVIISLVGQWAYPFLFLAIDFSLRALTQIQSPIAFSGKTIARSFGLKSRPIFAAPKKFAAGLGFIFSTAAFVFFAFQWYTAGYITGSVLIFCSLLESAFSICLGCYVYNYVVAPLLRKV